MPNRLRIFGLEGLKGEKYEVKSFTLLQDLQNLSNVFKCPNCGRSRFVKNTKWRGHGTGRHGEAQYEPIEKEKVSPTTHCICPGGPVWMELGGTSIGQELRLQESFEIWRKRGSNPKEVVVFLEGKFVSVPFDAWDKYLCSENL